MRNENEYVVLYFPLQRYRLNEANCEFRSRLRHLSLSYEHESYGADKLLA